MNTKSFLMGVIFTSLLVLIIGNIPYITTPVSISGEVTPNHLIKVSLFGYPQFGNEKITELQNQLAEANSQLAYITKADTLSDSALEEIDKMPSVKVDLNNVVLSNGQTLTTFQCDQDAVWLKEHFPQDYAKCPKK